MAAACGAYTGEDPPAIPAVVAGDAGDPEHDVDAGSEAPIVDASAPETEAAAPPRCNPAAPFGTPEPLAELNTGLAENAAWLTPDELTVYFARASRVLRATRTSATQAFSMPEPVPFANGTNDGDHPSLTPDELTIVVEVNNVLRTSTRPNATAPFPRTGAMAELNGTGAEGTANLSNGGRDIFFRRDVGNHFDLFMASRAAAVGAFGAPQLVPVSVGTFNDSNPVVREDGLELYFASTRGGGGANRTYVATRASRQEPFGLPAAVAELNTAGTANVPAWVSPDGCVIWFASNRPGGAGATDLYRAMRP